jgi:hypothetical protein
MFVSIHSASIVSNPSIPLMCLHVDEIQGCPNEIDCLENDILSQKGFVASNLKDSQGYCVINY